MGSNTENAEVWVYQYTYWELEARKERVSKLYATLDTIRLGLGVPISTSCIKVAAHEIVDGIYLPRSPEAINAIHRQEQPTASAD